MFRIALTMLMGDRPKYVGLIFGIGFTAFLVTFAGSFLCGFLTRGYSLISEDRFADVWVMDPAVSSVEQTINIPDSALDRVRSVAGVRAALPLLLGQVDARFPDGRFQPFQLIGVDDATLAGAPRAPAGAPAAVLRVPDAAIVDPGGTDDKLLTPALSADRWPPNPPRGPVPLREITAGDELLVNGQRLLIVQRTRGLPRYPPRPLLYTTLNRASRLLSPERHRLTFLLVRAAPGVDPHRLAGAIEARTGLRARTTDDFIADTVHWYLVNSEDVGDVLNMLGLAAIVGLGVTGVLLYLFTQENLKQYAVLSAMGATARTLVGMILIQSAACAVIGGGLGLGLCAIVGPLAASAGYPFRMLWFTPALGALTVILVSGAAALLSARPALKLQPAVVFAGR